jgi:DNA-binding transcriptional LysR family regulator
VVSHTHPLAKVNIPIALSELVQYCHVIVHDSSKNEIPWSVNIIKGSQRFYVSNITHKIAAIKAGIGIGYLPKYLIESQIASKQLTEIKLMDKKLPQALYMAWKITNQGKGLARLSSMLLGEK